MFILKYIYFNSLFFKCDWFYVRSGGLLFVTRLTSKESQKECGTRGGRDRIRSAWDSIILNNSKLQGINLFRMKHACFCMHRKNSERFRNFDFQPKLVIFEGKSQMITRMNFSILTNSPYI